jgi:hypothetical protein
LEVEREGENRGNERNYMTDGVKKAREGRRKEKRG